jgi:porin
MTRFFALLLAAAVLLPGVARADDEAPKSFWERDTLLGDLGGFRPWLAEHGVKLAMQTTDEGWGNFSGGLRRGWTYTGQSQAVLTVDTGKAFGWEGGTFQVSAYQIRGSAPTPLFTGSLQAVSSIEGVNTIRMYDLWYEQALFDGKLSVRAGQFGADEEFLINTTSAWFVSSTFGYPGLPATDLLGGGPAYPLSYPGVRVKVAPTGDITVLAALFNGSPVNPNATANPQAIDASGTYYRFCCGTLGFVEAQYALNQGDGATGLPGTYKLGAWFQNYHYNDQRYATNGVSLASPASSGVPGQLSPNYGLYAIADQVVWRRDGSKDQGITLFGRIMGTPGDRNLANFSVNGGATWKGIVPGRDGDTLGVGASYLRIGSYARGLSSDVAYYSNNPGYPLRDAETAFELSYQAQVTGWWVIQPDLQYVMQPGGNVPDPTRPGKKLRDSQLFAVRSVISF